MQFMVEDKTEKIIQIAAENTVGEIEEELKDKDGNTGRNHHDYPCQNFSFKMIDDGSHSLPHGNWFIPAAPGEDPAYSLESAPGVAGEWCGMNQTAPEDRYH